MNGIEARRQAAPGEPMSAESKPDIACMRVFAALRHASTDMYCERIARALHGRRATAHMLAKASKLSITQVRETLDAMAATRLVAREELEQRGCAQYVYWLDEAGWRALAEALFAFADSLEPPRRAVRFAPRLVGGRG